MHQKIIPNLWFDTDAEDAANFYITVFKNSRIVSVAKYPEGSPGEPGTVMTVEFELDGQRFVGINGGPDFKFDEVRALLAGRSPGDGGGLLRPRPGEGGARDEGDARNAEARHRGAARRRRGRAGELSRRGHLATGDRVAGWPAR